VIRSAFRYRGALFCARCLPEKAKPAAEEWRVVKPESLPGKACSECGVVFVEDSVAPVKRDVFRETWAKEVAEGKALPIAGELFPDPEATR
jgi:hypothetical protein